MLTPGHPTLFAVACAARRLGCPPDREGDERVSLHQPGAHIESWKGLENHLTAGWQTHGSPGRGSLPRRHVC